MAMKKAIGTILTTVFAGLILWYVTDVYFSNDEDRQPQGESTSHSALYDKLMAAVVPPQTGNNPLSDSRVQEALRNYLSPTGTGREVTRRLLAEAGYPDGIAVIVSRLHFEGEDAALKELLNRLAAVGIELRIN